MCSRKSATNLTSRMSRVKTAKWKRRTNPHANSDNGSGSIRMPSRTNQPELLDQNKGSIEDVRINLNEIWRINRYLGGVKALTRHLYPLLHQHSKPVRIV